MEERNKKDKGLSLKVIQHVSKDSISAAILFCLLLITLHFIEPEYNPLKNLISEYELGKYGWMMSLAFFSLASAVLAMVVATSNKKFNKKGIVGRVLFIIIFVALIGAGIFYPYPDTDKNVTLLIHTNCGLVVIIGFPIATLLLRNNLIRNAKNISESRRCISLATLFVIFGFVSFIGSIIVLGIISGSKKN